jgi:L-asparaginase II
MLMKSGDGSIACKLGAEGVHCLSYIPKGVGFASKVLDGANRARPPVTMAALRAFGAPAAAAAELQAFAHPIVYNRAGRAVGAIRVASDFAILKASSGR